MDRALLTRQVAIRRENVGTNDAIEEIVGGVAALRNLSERANENGLPITSGYPALKDPSWVGVNPEPVFDHTKAFFEASLLGIAALIVTRHQLVDAT